VSAVHRSCAANLLFHEAPRIHHASRAQRLATQRDPSTGADHETLL
jgi:hypothetical protein